MIPRLVICLLCDFLIASRVVAQLPTNLQTTTFDRSSPPLLLRSSVRSADTSTTIDRNETRAPSGWIRAGLGNCKFGLTGGLGAQLVYDNDVLILRYLAANEFVFGVDNNHPRPELSLKELALLFGKIYSEKHLRLSFAGGLGFVTGLDRGGPISFNEYERIKISTVSIPFESTALFVFPPLGIGFTWFGIVTNRVFVSGWLVQLHVRVFTD